MATVEVNGDINAALDAFKEKVRREGILKQRSPDAYRGKGNRKRGDGGKKR